MVGVAEQKPYLHRRLTLRMRGAIKKCCRPCGTHVVSRTSLKGSSVSTTLNVSFRPATSSFCSFRFSNACQHMFLSRQLASKGFALRLTAAKL